MAFTDHELFYGPGSKPQPERIEALSWAEALYLRKLHRNNVRLPAHMGHLSLEELQAKADEETRPQREAEEAAKRAKAVEKAGTAMERALYSGPPKHRTPGRIRVCFLAQLERWGSVGQAAAAAGVSVRTIQRWRNDLPAFNQRCEEALDRRQQLLEDKAMARAGKATAKPFFYKGQKLGEVENYNDSLLMRMIGQLNSRRRHTRPSSAAPAPAAAAPAPDPVAFATVLAASLGPVLREELARALEAERRRAMSPLVGQAESDPFPV
ncbi:hypothetical protein [Reyranella sp.]|uniref:hypothetical protein n=1 Tax=Reyranella sp. TaxID=1929291 RepID=UPI0027320ECB|nr:hypothetical protein [Reyranella sp.]MDP2375803.1 hypothetical protein [Reyranella sp.]